MEILRRVFLLAGVLTGVWSYLAPVPALVSVSYQDFAARQKKEPAWKGNRELPLEAFIAKKTEDHLIRVDGAEWEALLAGARAALAAAEEHTASPAEWRERVGTDYARRNLYFRKDDAPVRDVLGKFRGFTYVVVGEPDATRYLNVSVQDPESFKGDAPTALAYPRRDVALWPFLAGIGLYLLIPWPRRGEKTVSYARVGASWLPDGIGFMLTTTFFGLPLLIVPYMATSGELLDTEGGWIVFTLIVWAFGLFGVAIHGAAAWHTKLQVEILPDGLRRTTLFGSREYRFENIERVGLRVKQAPKALVKLGWLIAFFNWRAAGPTLLMASRSDAVLDVACRGGGGFRLGLTALENLDVLVDALDEAGVAVDDDVRKLVRNAG